jgi:hypothetical protein
MDKILYIHFIMELHLYQLLMIRCLCDARLFYEFRDNGKAYILYRAGLPHRRR